MESTTEKLCLRLWLCTFHNQPTREQAEKILFIVISSSVIKLWCTKYVHIDFYFHQHAIGKRKVVNSTVKFLWIINADPCCLTTYFDLSLNLGFAMLPRLALFISAVVSVNTNRPQRTTRMPVHLIKISEILLWTTAAASVLLRGLLRLCLSIYLLLWQTRADYYPGCTRDSSYYRNFLFQLQLAACPPCYSQNTCAWCLRLWQRKMKKLIFIKRNSFRLITRTKWATSYNNLEGIKSILQS